MSQFYHFPPTESTKHLCSLSEMCCHSQVRLCNPGGRAALADRSGRSGCQCSGSGSGSIGGQDSAFRNASRTTTSSRALLPRRRRGMALRVRRALKGFTHGIYRVPRALGQLHSVPFRCSSFLVTPGGLSNHAGSRCTRHTVWTASSRFESPSLESG
jgi:hypothetical protein